MTHVSLGPLFDSFMYPLLPWSPALEKGPLVGHDIFVKVTFGVDRKKKEDEKKWGGAVSLSPSLCGSHSTFRYDNIAQLTNKHRLVS